MPQHAPAELDRRGAPRIAERAPRRAATLAAPAGDGDAAQTVQRALDDSPRVAALERLGDALAQRRSADDPVVQRRVGPDEGRPGMEVRVLRNGKLGYIRGRVRNRQGAYVGWVVQTQVQVDEDRGTQHYLYDEVDPVDGPAVAAASHAIATSSVSAAISASASGRSAPPPSQPSAPVSLGGALGTSLGGSLAGVSALGTGSRSLSGAGALPPLTGGSASSNPNLFAASLGGSPSGGGPTTASSSASSASAVAVATASATSSAAPQADSVVREGDGVEFTVDNRFWHNGYVTQIDGSTYHVFVDSKMVRELLPSTVLVPAGQVRTSPAIKSQLGSKRTKREKREYRADRLASAEQVREVQGQSAAVSPLLLRHPVLFGPVLRSGGHTGTEAVSEVGRLLGLSVSMPQGTRGKSKNRPLANAIVATDTNAMLLTRLDDATTGPGQWTLHGKAAATDAADHPTLTETQLDAMRSVNLAEFRRRYVFSQGSVQGDSVSGIGKRTQMHAEAKAVRSRTWRHIIDQTVVDFTPAASASSSVASASLSSASASSAPAQAETRRKIIGIVINRSSCGGKSGYRGGCAQELADVLAAFWTELGQRLGAERAARLRAQGLIRIEVSVAGQYENEGQIENTVRAGARLTLHPNFDFEHDMPEPLNLSRYQYMRRLAGINAGQASGSGSGGDSGGEGDSELVRLLALIARLRASVRRPRSRVLLDVGQHQVFGMLNPAHSGEIACTSIAACALEQMLNSPGTQPDDEMLRTLIAAGTDIDADLRRGLGGGGGSSSGSGSGSGSGTGSRAPTLKPTLKRQATSSRVGGSGGSEPPALGELFASLTSALSKMPATAVARPPTSASASSSTSTTTSAGSMVSLPVGSQASAPSAKRSRPGIPASTATATATATSAPKKKVRESAAERYFAHDEVQGQFRGMRVDQAAIDAAGPQYLYGVRGDYRRIARQLVRGGPRTGLLVTIGGSTIMVANLSTMAQRRYALFDSHDQAVFETYDTELGLVEGINDLYPALPDIEEMDAAWYATPYRPT
jgi:hypothetical protein